ncbi:hypothetical protein HTV80_19760 [Streptomyces sp. Vc74B-19]|uniref:DUF5955 family protein n=1 Tax=unclassified Streptomyces TaxID=2593676 RepID=UPI001BFC0CA3|nr:MULTISPECIES: DUF5955 family protein [unclassified Streptomyces]MBT3165324.1 hypothetical protein [Streptomyces sp. Vc74B-19]MDU0300668.1 DUF5955 family protein [Streptomyces sp. PAL114]
MLRSVDQRCVPGSQVDPRVTELRSAVSRLRRQLAAHRAEFRDRSVAEEALATLAGLAAADDPDIPRLRRSLLLVAGAIGSVSALGQGVRELREAVDLFGPPPRP